MVLLGLVVQLVARHLHMSWVITDSDFFAFRYQIALYDVRYSKLDCMAARLSKVIQFRYLCTVKALRYMQRLIVHSVMIIFAATGPLFKVGGHPEDEDLAGSYYKTND